MFFQNMLADLATTIVKKFPHLVVQNDNVLLAITRTFPMGQDNWKTLIYPFVYDICEMIVLELGTHYFENIMDMIQDIPDDVIFGTIQLLLYLTLMVPYPCLLGFISSFAYCYRFFIFQSLCFISSSGRLQQDSTHKHIEKKKATKEVLKLVCDEIETMEVRYDHHPNRNYKRTIIEAACQDIYEVVNEILMRSPEAIRYKFESQHDKNLQPYLYHWEHKSVYRWIEYSSKNNMLNLEMEKLVFPTCTTKENISNETPDKVFRREHRNLVKEAEKWMKAVAESCNITAALITTIVFEVAITIPGGRDQDTGIPLFTKEIAFTIFAITDAISLFASSTTLLMFLPILKRSFYERFSLHFAKTTDGWSLCLDAIYNCHDGGLCW
uniref:PGG domain-containing protein n=1 Tax=Lactuca sativa TaxID=4236 RepID=A0A9R1X164_LACSA|nr:hypothetical protein LSAT_V11C700362880 [Lactuca sativa]